MSNIKLINITKIILSYIKEPDFKLKLFCYSKYFQNKLGIKLFDYQKIYLDSKGCSLEKYFHNFKEKNIDWKHIWDVFGENNYKNVINIGENYYNNISERDKEILSNKLNEDLKNEFKIDINSFKEYVLEYFKLITNFKLKSYLIDMYSPLFDLLIDIENFEKIFIIPILVMREKEIEIDENNIDYDNYYQPPNLNDPDLYSSKESDYIAIFNKLNKSNRKYSLSINYQDFDIKYFKKLGIRFDMIERLTFFEVKEGKNKDIFKNMF